MKLFARVKDADLLLKSLNEQGTAFYRVVKGSQVEAIYFSASRTIHFHGKITQHQLETLKAQAYEAKRFDVNEQLGIIEVSQMEE